MAEVSRSGDTNTVGGAIVGGASTVFVNGKPVGQVGNTLTAHSPWPKKKNNPHPPHAKATVTSGSPSVFADGIAVAKVGSSNSCGHSMASGSPDVFVA